MRCYEFARFTDRLAARGCEQFFMVGMCENRLEHERDRERDLAGCQQWIERREATCQARQVDATAGFVFAHAQPRDAVVEHRAMCRLQMQAPFFHFAKVGDELGQGSAPDANYIVQAFDQLCMREVVELPEFILLHHCSSIRHGFRRLWVACRAAIAHSIVFEGNLSAIGACIVERKPHTPFAAVPVG